MADDNGVTRREFSDLKTEVRDLAKLLNEVDREGSAATKRLQRDHDKLDATVAWIIRGFIASIGLAVLVWVIIQGQSSP